MVALGRSVDDRYGPCHGCARDLGVIMSGNIGCYQEMHKAFVAALVTEGFDYHKVDMLLPKPSPDPLSWTNAARKLSVAEVNVLVPDSAHQADELTQLESHQYGFQTVRMAIKYPYVR